MAGITLATGRSARVLSAFRVVGGCVYLSSLSNVLSETATKNLRLLEIDPFGRTAFFIPRDEAFFQDAIVANKRSIFKRQRG